MQTCQTEVYDLLALECVEQACQAVNIAMCELTEDNEGHFTCHAMLQFDSLQHENEQYLYNKINNQVVRNI